MANNQITKIVVPVDLPMEPVLNIPFKVRSIILTIGITTTTKAAVYRYSAW